MKNVIGWVKFNENMDGKQADTEADDCCPECDKKPCECDDKDKDVKKTDVSDQNEKKKNPFAKMNAEKKKEGGKKATASKKEDKKDDKKGKQLPPWLEKKKK